MTKTRQIPMYTLKEKCSFFPSAYFTQVIEPLSRVCSDAQMSRLPCFVHFWWSKKAGSATKSPE